MAAVALAQRKQNNNYTGSRPQNPNKGKYQKPTTTAYVKPTAAPKPPKGGYGGNGAGNGGNGGNGGVGGGYQGGNGGNQSGANNGNTQFGAGFGDPHFMVSSLGQEPICFDYNPPAGSEMTLVMDPETSLHVSAKVDGRRQGKTRFMTRIAISSPLGAQLTIDEHGVSLAGLPSWVDSTKPVATDNRIIEYGDIKYTETWSEDGSRDKITVEIEDGPAFLIKEKALRETISFGITSTHGLSSKTRGVIGQFVKANAYTVERTAKDFATIHIEDYEVESEWKTFHRNTQCWTIEEEDLIPLFELSK